MRSGASQQEAERAAPTFEVELEWIGHSVAAQYASIPAAGSGAGSPWNDCSMLTQKFLLKVQDLVRLKQEASKRRKIKLEIICC